MTRFAQTTLMVEPQHYEKLRQKLFCENVSVSKWLRAKIRQELESDPGQSQQESDS